MNKGEIDLWFDELPNKCRTCDLEFDKNSHEFKSGVFEIPSTLEILQWYDIKNSHRIFDTNLFLYYCSNCFIRKMLKKDKQCCHCGIFAPKTKKILNKSTTDGTLKYPQLHINCDFLPIDFYLCFTCTKILLDKGFLFGTFENEFNNSTNYLSIQENNEDENNEKDLEIKCDICNDKFISIMDDIGDGCDSSIDEYEINSGYGSQHDGDIFKWKSGIMPKEYRNKKVICDNCINHLLQNEIIEKK